MTQYDEKFALPIVSPPQSMDHILGNMLADANLRNLRTAETEKFAHVTFFFNGGVEKPFGGEERILTPSPKVATYDLQPEMSSVKVGDSIEKAILDTSFRRGHLQLRQSRHGGPHGHSSGGHQGG